jgi:hypothetical protein
MDSTAAEAAEETAPHMPLSIVPPARGRGASTLLMAECSLFVNACNGAVLYLGMLALHCKIVAFEGGWRLHLPRVGAASRADIYIAVCAVPSIRPGWDVRGARRHVASVIGFSKEAVFHVTFAFQAWGSVGIGGPWVGVKHRSPSSEIW